MELERGGGDVESVGCWILFFVRLHVLERVFEFLIELVFGAELELVCVCKCSLCVLVVCEKVVKRMRKKRKRKRSAKKEKFLK